MRAIAFTVFVIVCLLFVQYAAVMHPQQSWTCEEFRSGLTVCVED